jgi:ABC-type branched-subunit amino acid transport system substrate-binding protein
MARSLEFKRPRGHAAWAALLAGSLALAGCMESGRMAQRKTARAPALQAEPAYEADIPPSDVPQAPGPGHAGAPAYASALSSAPPDASVPAYAPAPGATGGATLGNGPIRVALLLPLSAPGQGSVAAQSLRNAADLALSESQGAELTILVKDDRGTPEGAQAAASQALAEGAELIIGPLFAGSVGAAGGVVRQSGKPVIAFSTDTGVATRGVYLLSFLVQAEVDRIVSFAAAQGRRSIAALIPDTAYGRVAEAQLQQAAAEEGLRVVAVERYPAGQPQGAVQRLGRAIGGPSPQADALFIPENGDGLPQVAQALQGVGFNPERVKPLGTGVWNEARVFGLPTLQGGWFAAPDNRGFAAFAARYRARFNADPIRLATLSYDAVTLAAALARIGGARHFTPDALTNPAGFAGADGVFRFNPNGTNDRALAVQEIRNGAAATISGAPRTLVAGN